MPDRDEFSRRPRAFKSLSAMFERMVGGAPPDVGVVEKALRRLVASSGGIPSLEAVIETVHGVRQAELFGSLDELGALERIRDAVGAHGEGKLDKVLERSAAAAVLTGRIDVPEIIASTLEDAVSHFVLEAREGVIPSLAARGIDATSDQLLRPIRSVMKRAAQELARRPSARALKLRSAPTPVDLHADLRGVHP
ncbi:hypothetical protein [Anaeromyxobacter dehalogenans]|uniref:hypothetical protein n=1 Tax=Anaeromyxobacter dehalogenans TaxID=161493 RepID=UPI00123785BF|nr:hypothetical protein [Anaeromyxobacter dehalogenans]